MLLAMNGDRVHPFFSRTNQQPKDEAAIVSRSSADYLDTLEEQTENALPEKTRTNKRKKTAPVSNDGKLQATLNSTLKLDAPVKKEDGARYSPEVVTHTGIEPGPPKSGKTRKRPKDARTCELENRGLSAKRRRTDEEISIADDAEPSETSSQAIAIDAKNVVGQNERDALEVKDPNASLAAPKPPGGGGKMLALNSTGRFSPPKSTKPPVPASSESDSMQNASQASSTPSRTGRRKNEAQGAVSRLVARLVYMPVSDIGKRIGLILSGEERVQINLKPSPRKQRPQRKAAPLKSVHPFFESKPKVSDAPKPAAHSPRRPSAVTPGKLRRQTMMDRPPQSAYEPPPAFVSDLLRDRTLIRQPGARDPLWPTRENLHVRSFSNEERTALQTCFQPFTPIPQSKLKTSRRPIARGETILAMPHLLTEDTGGHRRRDGFNEPHPSIRKPARLVMGGINAARLASGQMNASASACSGASLDENAHPALHRLHRMVPDTLSAFETGEGDHYGWVQKYAPQTAADVLQPTKTMAVLKDWLQSLTVNSTRAAPLADQKRNERSEKLAPKSKKRKKPRDLDDFIVDSDSEGRELAELSELEDDVPASSALPRSMVQLSNSGVKASNAALISGPNGCGKTAAVYAVAKELGYKVFEISSSECRSGRDVLDKVGDMTENHIVRRHDTEPSSQSAVEDDDQIDEAFQRDLDSGRQGKMSAFFKPQVGKAKAIDAISAKPKVVKSLAAVQKTLKKSTHTQQQSLILLEEVDVLFAEDKDFWTTVLKLIHASRRPFVLTCNNEAFVPFQAISFHAILRFKPPPASLATDYLILLAAAEGHLLQRDAISSLYAAKHQDLRASIAELDFWCQMGIGDPRAGLAWMYQRYPPGVDRDEEGQLLRVMSKDTYFADMSCPQKLDLSNETRILQAAQESSVDYTASIGLAALGQSCTSNLRDYALLGRVVSDLDLISVPPGTFVADTSQKGLSDKAKLNYIDGLPLLQTDEAIQFSSVASEIGISVALAAFRRAEMHDTDLLNLSLAADEYRLQLGHPQTLTRQAYACFDAIAVGGEQVSSADLTASSFDGPIGPIATDLAPYVRSIVQYECAQEAQRDALDALMNPSSSDGSKRRSRNTRAARSAAEGGLRSEARKVRWFTKQLQYDAVLKTGGPSWPKNGLAAQLEDDEATGPTASRAGSVQSA